MKRIDSYISRLCEEFPNESRDFINDAIREPFKEFRRQIIEGKMPILRINRLLVFYPELGLALPDYIKTYIKYSRRKDKTLLNEHKDRYAEYFRENEVTFTEEFEGEPSFHHVRVPLDKERDIKRWRRKYG